MEIGALWTKTDKNGKQFFSGTITLPPFGEMNVAVFANDRKTSDNQPDYKIVYSKPRKGEDTIPF